MRHLLRLAAVTVLAWHAIVGQGAQGQFGIPTPEQLRGFDVAAQGKKDEPPLLVKANFTALDGNQSAKLYITADIREGWHIYSITQAKGGPVPTKIDLGAPTDFKVKGEFTAVPPAKVHPAPEFDNLLVEEHSGTVTWWAPIELAAGAKPDTLKIEGKLTAQACNAGNCLPPAKFPFTAALGKAPIKLAGVFESDSLHATIQGHVDPQVVQPSGKVQLVITAEVADQWHIYALADRDPKRVSKPTLIEFTQLNGWTAGRPIVSSEPIAKPSDKAGDPPDLYHEGKVTWRIEIAIPANASPGDYEIKGIIGAQTCWPAGCDRPMGIRFSATVPVAQATVAGQIPLAFTSGPYGEAAKLADARLPASAGEALSLDKLRQQVSDSEPTASTPLMLLYGFLGGLILNLMPCVLPVIGLKVLSFVEQSGHDRKRVLILNVWYSLGLITVFMVLAAFAVGAGLGWGQQFASNTFNVVLAGVVFAMGLSFLGVWEIPIPGFVGTNKANDLAAKEGVAGAYAKGMITTVLATPCTGPFLGTALAWGVRQPAYLTMMLFFCAGLGMASPYLLIGAFPNLVKFLPKPGAWMDTFKQMMGFVLLGTVVYLMTFIDWQALVPTIAMLFGIWAGCWWIGRTPAYAETGVRVRAWMAGLSFAAAVGLFSFNWLGEVMNGRLERDVEKQIAARFASPAGTVVKKRSEAELPWQPFTQAALAELTSQNKTVMIDFTADWCAICQTLKFAVLDTKNVKGAVDENSVVPLLADWTKGDAEITALLESLGSKSVPVLAIFPAGRPNRPIVFKDPYSQQQLLDALKQAGPSQELKDVPKQAGPNAAPADATWAVR